MTAPGDPILIVDRNGRIIDANPACSRLLDIPATELPDLDLTKLLEPGTDLVGKILEAEEQEWSS